MSDGRQTVAGAYAAIETHEKICAERYLALGVKLHSVSEEIAGTKRTIDKIVWLAFTILLSMVGWMGLQLWDQVGARVS